MIQTINGRSFSFLTETERTEAVNSLISSLTPEEREVLKLVIKEFKKGDPVLYNLMTESEYIRPVVSMETFLTDENYFATVAKNLYPRWIDDLIELFSNDYDTVLLTGAIGTGKTTFAKVCICRIIYEMSCLRDPLKTYGLMPGSRIVVPIINITQEQARNAIFEDLYNMFNLCPYFMDLFRPDKKADKITFPNNITIILGSYSDSRFIGLNVFSALLDECNFYSTDYTSKSVYDSTNLYDSAEALYTSIERRRKSRYLKGGVLPGKIIISSSKKVNDEFTERKIKEFRDNPRVFVRDYAIYDVKPKHFFMPTSFKVLIGDSFVRSRILTDEEYLKYKDNTSLRIIEVPDDFRPDFEKDIDGAIREIAGIATSAVHPFIRYGIESCVELSKKYNYTHPFPFEVLVQGSTDSFLWSKLVTYSDGGMMPIISPNASRIVHIDTSIKGDFTGFCMGHVLGHKKIFRKIGGETFEEVVPVFFIDIMLRISASDKDDIIFGDVRKLVYSLSEHGYHIAKITLDSYQSRDYIQHFTKKGYESEVLSVDRSIAPYEVLRQAIYEERIVLYPYEPVIKELRALEFDRTKNKIDHPKKGYKDVADALAGVVYGLSQMSVSDIPLVDSDASLVVKQTDFNDMLEEYSDLLFERSVTGDRVLYRKELLPDSVKEIESLFAQEQYDINDFLGIL